MSRNWEIAVRHFERANLPARLLEAGSKGFGSAVAVRVHPKRGEFFALRPDPEEEPTVMEASTRRRHILLLIRGPERFRRLLFGHDERHLFVARLPADARPSRLAGAFDALKPTDVLAAEAAGLPPIRQGEWFFIPAPDFLPGPGSVVRRKAPLRIHHPFDKYVRDHVADELVRVLEGSEEPTTRSLLVYVRGTVRHVEHRTLRLAGWHRVLHNREGDNMWSIDVQGTTPWYD